MNHRSVLNGTPLDARFTNVALEARGARLRPGALRLHRHERRPAHRRAGRPAAAHLRGRAPRLPGRCSTCPRRPRAAWVELAARTRAYDVPDDVRRPVRSRVGRPARGAPARRPTRPSTARPRSSPSALLAWLARPAATSPWFAHARYLRPHPPYRRARAVRHAVDPADGRPFPAPPTDEAEEARSTRCSRWPSRSPIVGCPDDEARAAPARATYYGMMAEVDDQLGRLLDWLDAIGPGRRHARGAHVGPRRELGDHWLMREARLVRRGVPRAADRPRSRAEADAHARHVVDALHRARRRDADDRSSGSASRSPLQCDGRSLSPFLARRAPARPTGAPRCTGSGTSATPIGALLDDAFGLTLEECALAVIRDEHGKYVHFSGLRAALLRPRRRPRPVRRPRRRPRVRATGAGVRAADAVVAHAARRTHAHEPRRHARGGARLPARPPRSRARHGTGIMSAGGGPGEPRGAQAGGRSRTATGANHDVVDPASGSGSSASRASAKPTSSPAPCCPSTSSSPPATSPTVAREKAAADFGVTPFADAADLFASGAVDAVAIATPPSTHGPLVEGALAAGPARLLREAADAHRRGRSRSSTVSRAEAGRVVQVGLQFRFQRSARATRELLAAARSARCSAPTSPRPTGSAPSTTSPARRGAARGGRRAAAS